jgi:hypothetical protein
VVDAGTGLAVLGTTTTPADSGYGGSGTDLLLARVPYDGGLTLTPDANLDVRYTRPDMVPSSSDLEQLAIGTTVTDITLTLSTATAIMSVPTIDEYPIGMAWE